MEEGLASLRHRGNPPQSSEEDDDDGEEPSNALSSLRVPSRWTKLPALPDTDFIPAEKILATASIARIGEPVLLRARKRAAALVAHASDAIAGALMSFCVASAKSNAFGKKWAKEMATILAAAKKGAPLPDPFNSAHWEELRDAAALPVLAKAISVLGTLNPLPKEFEAILGETLPSGFL